MRGTSMADIGSYNEKLVLQMIRSAPGGMSQSQVVRGSGLSRQTVSLIARRLLQEGLIETAGQRISGPGKPSTTLQAVADSRWTIGLHVDPAYLTIVICDLQGNAVDTTILAAPSEDSAADIARIAAEIERLCTRHGAVKIHDAPASAPAPAQARAPTEPTGGPRCRIHPGEWCWGSGSPPPPRWTLPPA